MKLRCTCCHADFYLEQALEDTAARELMALLAGQEAYLTRPLVAYLGLFRAKTRALAWERALRLAQEVLTLSQQPQHLSLALSETVESLRHKQQQASFKPLTNHNYLKQVLASQPAPLPTSPLSNAATQAFGQSGSKTLQAIENLMGLTHG